jgi:poly-gamma-glutamate capsule biosynthesis protein CapA/YwtB (metallophosphatase superfamily)
MPSTSPTPSADQRAALPLLKKYFSAVSLANNHSGDWGKKGFATELELLRETKLPYFGGGTDLRAAHQPLVLTANGKRVAFLGYNDFPPRSFAAGPTTPGTAWLIEKDVIRDIQNARKQADLVLLFLHWSEDLVPQETPEQQAQAHRFIDAGADAVIGGHAHLTQGIEWYKDRPIVYSLGNFVFDYFPYDPPSLEGLDRQASLRQVGAALAQANRRRIRSCRHPARGAITWSGTAQSFAPATRPR